MTKNNFRSHFSTFQINTQLFFEFFSQYGRRRQFWITENHFRSHFSTFQININFFLQNNPRRAFWMTENHFRSHFSPFEINAQLFFCIFFTNGCRRPFWMTENHFRSHFSPFQINNQLGFFFKIFTKWLPAANLDDRKSFSITFLAISDQYATFIFFEFFSQNGRRRPFWMIENHFRSHFSPFQINTQLLFFVEIFVQNGRRRPFWKSDLRRKQ